MTQNNMTLEEAKKLLEEWDRGLSCTRQMFSATKVDRLIHAARTVQRAEDAEIVKNMKCPCNNELKGCSGFDFVKNTARKKLLTPEAPLSDNPEKL